MDQRVSPAPEQIRRARLDNPKMRERDLALQIGISEAELVVAHIGDGVVRIEPRANDVLSGLEAVGEVMALTRNESAVHEKVGIYDAVVPGEQAAMVLGSEIDLRVFPKVWAHGFAVEKRDDGDVKHSLQFFDAAGDAVHKVHLRPASNLYAFQKLVASLESQNQSPHLAVTARPAAQVLDDGVTQEALRAEWGKLTDTHAFFGMLRKLRIGRRQALRTVGEDYAWLLDHNALVAMLNLAAQDQIPIMCFVGNRGCIQIHSGPITTIKPMGPWINILDETFHMHLRLDHIRETWAVRKPTEAGHVTSIEAYDESGEMVIQFFGKRREGVDERENWRFLAENLPRIPRLANA